MWAVLSSSYVASVPSSSMGDCSRSSHDLVWDPSHGRQSSTNFSKMSHSPGLQFFTNCSSVGPFHGVTRPAGSLLQCGIPRSLQTPFGHPPALAWISPTGCRWISAPAPGAPCPSPSPLTLVTAELFFLHVLTPLSGCSCC